MHPDELRQKFREFFVSRNHQEIRSASLIPSSDDPTVLFTTAGMQPLVPNLLGAAHPAGKRLFDTQKVFRTPDIDEVGDDTHCTFFEMLGNWSLGDYFKEEAITLAYDFFVDVLKLDPKRFGVTIFKGDSDAPRDDEAERIWLSKPGIEQHQIFEFDKKDNFWGPAGKTGPCGPCSEIHYDRGEKYGENFGPNSDENQRYVEIWNLVFMEYDKHEDGSYSKLSQHNVDTGVGFERLIAVLNQVNSPFDTPLFENIIKRIEAVTRKAYDEHKRAFRIIADHARGATFLIGDGVTPGNEGRNYVLRRLIRRAIREGKKLGVADAFLGKIAEVVIADYAKHYPELLEQQKAIMTVLDLEEQNFGETLGRGEKMLQEIVAKKPRLITGEEAFRLFDTYGFPLDLTKDFAQEHGIEVDSEGFALEMRRQQDRSRVGAAASFERASAVQKFADLTPTVFTGYEEEKNAAKVLGVLKGDADEAFVVLDQSPFYAESGGQVGDSGIIKGPHGELVVSDCQKTATGVFIHTGSLKGEISSGETVTAEIDRERREQIRRHHSLAHIFLGAAQQVLGRDVHQAGSHVNEYRMRFDFTFPRALDEREIEAIEDLMAKAVTASAPVEAVEKALAEAKSEGVEAMFGEKYGDRVRTIRMGAFSYELCGGTHVRNTAQLGAIKIISESGVSAGVRRVEVVCAEAARKLLKEKYAAVRELAAKLKVPTHELFGRVDGLLEERKDLTNKLGAVQKQLATAEAKRLATNAETINGIKLVIVADLEADGQAAGVFARSLVSEGCDLGIVLTTGGNAAIASNGKPAAADVLKALNATFGGGGGGNATFASGGGLRGTDAGQVRELLSQLS